MDLTYRRSLASRVILLTTLAVGLSVALVALAAYYTVRHQLQSTMDQSLKDRARLATQYDINPFTVQDIPQWMNGATETRVGYLNHKHYIATTRGPDGDVIKLGAPEKAVAAGSLRYVCRTISTNRGDFRVVTVPAKEAGYALLIGQSLESNENALGKLGLVMFLFGAAGVIAAACAGYGVARNGLRPVRQLTDAAEEIARTEKLDPIRIEGNDEIARLARASTRCWPRCPRPGTGSASSSRTRATSSVLRSPRCAPTWSCSRRPRSAAGSPRRPVRS